MCDALRIKAFRLLGRCVPILVALVTVFGASIASAEKKADSQLVPVHAKHRGHSYAEWSARHWQWLYSLPIDEHPLFDNADCSTGQSGHVWFLGGTYASSEIAPGPCAISNSSTAAPPSVR